jgi:hypothetical protein
VIGARVFGFSADHIDSLLCDAVIPDSQAIGERGGGPDRDENQKAIVSGAAMRRGFCLVLSGSVF